MTCRAGCEEVDSQETESWNLSLSVAGEGAG